MSAAVALGAGAGTGGGGGALGGEVARAATTSHDARCCRVSAEDARATTDHRSPTTSRGTVLFTFGDEYASMEESIQVRGGATERRPKEGCAVEVSAGSPTHTARRMLPFLSCVGVDVERCAIASATLGGLLLLLLLLLWSVACRRAAPCIIQCLVFHSRTAPADACVAWRESRLRV
jgi:hypothetical protein